MAIDNFARQIALEALNKSGGGDVPADVYSKAETDNLLRKKADKSQFITLTQAEYDALTEEQKKNGSYYFIKEV